MSPHLASLGLRGSRSPSFFIGICVCATWFDQHVRGDAPSCYKPVLIWQYGDSKYQYCSTAFYYTPREFFDAYEFQEVTLPYERLHFFLSTFEDADLLCCYRLHYVHFNLPQ